MRCARVPTLHSAYIHCMLKAGTDQSVNQWHPTYRQLPGPPSTRRVGQCYGLCQEVPKASCGHSWAFQRWPGLEHVVLGSNLGAKRGSRALGLRVLPTPSSLDKGKGVRKSCGHPCCLAAFCPPWSVSPLPHLPAWEPAITDRNLCKLSCTTLSSSPPLWVSGVSSQH